VLGDILVLVVVVRKFGRKGEGLEKVGVTVLRARAAKGLLECLWALCLCRWPVARRVGWGWLLGIVDVARAVVEKWRWERWMGVVVVVESLVEGVVGVVIWVIEGGGALGWVIGGSKAVEGVVRICEGVVRFCIGVVRFCDGVGMEGIVMMVGSGVEVVGGESVSAVVEGGVARGMEGGAGGWGLEEEAATMVGVVAGVVCAVDDGWGCCSLMIFLLVGVDGEVVCGLVVVGAMAVDWELSEVLKAWVGMLLVGSSSFLGR
jgi:hypothetical protein